MLKKQVFEASKLVCIYLNNHYYKCKYNAASYAVRMILFKSYFILYFFSFIDCHL